MAKHDVCNTSKMKAVYNPAMIHITGTAKTDLDNGRIALLNAVTEEVSYAGAKTEKRIFLVKSGEKLYDHPRQSLEDFYTVKGKKVRIFEIAEYDEFETSAFPEGTKLGDGLQIGADGKLVAYDDGAWKFTVVELSAIGIHPTVIVKAELV